VRTLTLVTLATAIFCIGQVHAQVQNHDPSSPSLRIEQAIKAYDAGKREEAHSLLATLAETGKANEVAYFYLGMIAYDAGDFTAAEAHFRKAISINPNYAPPYSDLSAILLEQQKLEEAENMAEKATKLDPSYAPGFANLGMVQYLRNKKEDAYDSFLAAAKLDPAIITSSGAEMLTQYNDPNAALYYLNISLAAAPNHPLTLLDAGQAYRMLGDNKKAKELLKRGYEVTPVGQGSFDVLYSSYFRLLLDTGDYDTIIRDGFSKVGPNYPNGYLLRSLAFYQQGKKEQFEEAAKHYFSLIKEPLPASLDVWAREYINGHKKNY
jgi:tetratricopeptide (TPR) repeat protein